MVMFYSRTLTGGLLCCGMAENGDCPTILHGNFVSQALLLIKMAERIAQHHVSFFFFFFFLVGVFQ
jgi:hypothetical protein